MDPFVGVAGHDRPLQLLRGQLASQRLPQAYLFVGESGLGKTLVARRLAAALLPEVDLRRHPDYWEDDREGNLSINEVRLLPDRAPEHHEQSLQAFLALKPGLGSRRVALITDVGRLKDEVQGILLKTLEEPHPGHILILTASSASPFVVLPTVVSRCQRVDFRPLPATDIAALLETQGVDPATAQSLGRLALGRPGWALEAASDPGRQERYRGWGRRLEEVLDGDAVGALRLAAELDAAHSAWRAGDHAEEDPLAVALTAWQLELRDRMLRAEAPARWARLLELSFETLGHLEQNVSARLTVEWLLLECQGPAAA